MGGGYDYKNKQHSYIAYMGSSLCELSFNLYGTSIDIVVPIYLNNDYIFYIKEIPSAHNIYFISRSNIYAKETILVEYGDSPIRDEACTREERDYYLSLIPESWILKILSSEYKTTYMYKLPIR